MSENDPFEEATDPTISYIVDRWSMADNGVLVVEGRVESITTEVTVRRAGMGGDSYDSDQVRVYGKLIPNGLKADVRIAHADAEIRAEGDDMAIVRAVVKRFGRSLELACYDLMVTHEDTIQLHREANAPVKQKSGMTGKKPVSIEKPEEPKGEVL